jgi:hypothetical protein
MYLDVQAAQKQWDEAEHPLLDYMCHTHHPDLRLGRL